MYQNRNGINPVPVASGWFYLNYGGLQPMDSVHYNSNLDDMLYSTDVSVFIQLTD